MDNHSNSNHPRDRRDDRHASLHDGHYFRYHDLGDRVRLHKPPVLRRSTLRMICAVWLGMVLYGTLGPMGGGERPWIEAPEQWRWAPPAYPISYTSYNDIFTNVLVYLPVGVALTLLLRRRGGVWAAEMTVAMFLAVTLSYFTELLQQLMPARCSDRVDLYVNSASALAGCLLAPAAQSFIRRGHALAYEHCRRRPWLTAAWAMTILTAVLMTLPWDFYWPSLEVEYKRAFDLLDVRRFGTFIALGFLVAMAMIERHGRIPLAFGEALKRIFICGVYCETAQIFLLSHACGLLDMSTAFLGGMAGIGAARWLTATTLLENGMPTHTRRALATLLLFGLVAADMGLGVWRILSGSELNIGPAYIRAPFQVQFLESFDRVMINMFEYFFLYASIAMLCLYLTQGQGKRAALLLLVGLTGGIGLAGVLLGGQALDLTPIVVAFASWIVTARCWRAFIATAKQSRGAPATLHATTA